MGKRTTQLGEITTIDDNDILYGVDVSDLTHSPDGTSVKFKKSNLLKEVNSRAGDIESDVSELQGIISGLLDWFYPVGTIYETTSSDLDTTTKMGNHFGGTWEAYGEGRVLVGKAGSGTFATAGATGGAETHTLSEAEMPSHAHKFGFVTGPNQATGSPYADGREMGYAPTNRYVSTESKGSSSAHNNLQPYIVVYMWKRTA